MVVYADLLFLINALFNCSLLLTTALIWKEQTSIMRLLLSILIGSLPLYSIIFSQAIIFTTLYGKIIISFSMIFVAFQIKNIRLFLKLISTFYFVTFFTGGMIIALQNLFNITGNKVDTYFIANNMLYWVFVLLAFPVSLLFYKKHIGSLQMYSIKKQHLVSVTLKVNEQEINAIGLIDTGNHLVDPITRTPVIIMSSTLLHRMLPENIVCTLDKQIQLLSILEENEEWKKRFVFVPYKVVGKEHNLLPCIKPDEIILFYENKHIKTKRVYIGLNSFPISNDDSYQLIIHPKLLTTS